jgi:hypothetical protein
MFFPSVHDYVPDTTFGYLEELAGDGGDGDGDTECAYHVGPSILDRHLQAFGEYLAYIQCTYTTFHLSTELQSKLLVVDTP